MKSFMERWPRRTWFSVKNRVLFAAQRLHDVADRNNSSIRIVRSQHDLQEVGKKIGDIHGILGIEGLSGLENNLDNVDLFYNAGVRLMYVFKPFFFFLFFFFVSS